MTFQDSLTPGGNAAADVTRTLSEVDVPRVTVENQVPLSIGPVSPAPDSADYSNSTPKLFGNFDFPRQSESRVTIYR